MIKEHVDKFFALAKERELIYKRRIGAEDNPFAPFYTEDPIFRKWRFCCRHREDDKTTRWFRTSLREPLRDRARDVLMATVAFRWFNRIETGEKLVPFFNPQGHGWDTEMVRAVLKDQRPVVTGAYIIKTPNGMNKLDGVLWCIDQVAKDADHLAGALGHTPPDDRTMEGVWTELMEYPYLGGFMAYQIVSDLRYTCWLDKAADRYMWAAPGPGSTRGLGWLQHDEPSAFSMNNKKNCVYMRELMHELVVKSADHYPKMWEAQEVQHWLCEYDKYTRASKGQDQKRKFS